MIVVSIPKSGPKSGKAPLRIRTLAADAPNERAFDEWRIDARTGRVVDQDLYRRRSLGQQVVDARLAVHRGSFFGLPGAIVFMLAAAAMPLFPITGYLLYLGRRRSKAARSKTA
jgi:sulfite reductase (NADPH) flavoprotein alpha-component